MRLLISVMDAAEARVALEGDADIIDVKDPTRGALGAADNAVLREVVAAVGDARSVSAALGDAADERAVEAAARAAASERLAYVKVGFAGITDLTRVEALLSAAVRGVRTVSAGSGVVAVAYADAERVGSISPMRLIEAAERALAIGVLLDTASKDGRGLFDLMDQGAVGRWVSAAHEAALTVALAGSLKIADLATVRALGADIAGVRGAACEGGRTGHISRERVEALVSANRRMTRAPRVVTGETEWRVGAAPGM
ncbi:MAG TPA: (5-formylfuran-3-yl)methyl phosphate synthase [Gemmatimonadaceae bacterium]